jgi:thiamine kinase-like enzyme
VDFRIENAVFQSMSDQKTGPFCHYQCKEYRIEEFFVSRPISIFEMRVDHFLKAYGQKICDFNNNQQAQEKVAEIRPKDKWFFDELKEWHAKLAQILPEMKATVKTSSYLKIIEDVERTFYGEGYVEKLAQVAGLDQEPVLSHCDAQENNILASLENPLKIMIIDLEYSLWGPRSLDIANYINETMLDNAYPCKNGIAVYTENLATDPEQEVIMRNWLERFATTYKKDGLLEKGSDELKSYIETELPKMKEEVKGNLIVNNAYWGIWALMMLKKEDWDKEGVFNYDFADARVKMIDHVTKVYHS